MKKKILSILVCGIALLGLTGCGNGKLEKEVIDYAKEVRNNMKYPATFEITGDIIYIKGRVMSSKEHDYYFIPYSAETKNGTKMNDIAIINDGEYVGDIDDTEPNEITSSKSELEYYYTYVNDAKMVYQAYKGTSDFALHGEDPVIIKKDKIIKKID